jgi:hypothetical protein
MSQWRKLSSDCIVDIELNRGNVSPGWLITIRNSVIPSLSVSSLITRIYSLLELNQPRKARQDQVLKYYKRLIKVGVRRGFDYICRNQMGEVIIVYEFNWQYYIWIWVLRDDCMHLFWNFKIQVLLISLKNLSKAGKCRNAGRNWVSRIVTSCHTLHSTLQNPCKSFDLS